MRQPRIELGPKRWQRSILPLNYCRLLNTLKSKSIYSQFPHQELNFLFYLQRIFG